MYIIDINSDKFEAIKYLKQVESKYIEYLDNYNGEILVDTLTDRIVAQVFVGKSGTHDEYFITGLEVYEPYKGKGYGHKILSDAVNKYNGIDLVVHKDNVIALKMYKKFGFIIIEDIDAGKDFYYMRLKNENNKHE